MSPQKRRLFEKKKKKEKNLKSSQLLAVYNIAPQCLKNNKIAPQTTKM